MWRTLGKPKYRLCHTELSHFLGSVQGWKMNDDASTLSKEFHLGDYGPVCDWMGRSLRFCYHHYAEEPPPSLKWFFYTVTVSFSSEDLLNNKQAQIAAFLNDTEIHYATKRNTSDGMSVSGIEWPAVILEDTGRHSAEHFKLLYPRGECNGIARRDEFLNTSMAQWYQRADYLVKRYSRDKDQQRQQPSQMTLDEMIKGADGRKRRKERREKRSQEMTAQQEEEEERRLEEQRLEQALEDPTSVLPRETREKLMEAQKDDGFQDVRRERQGHSPLLSGRSLNM